MGGRIGRSLRRGVLAAVLALGVGPSAATADSMPAVAITIVAPRAFSPNGDGNDDTLSATIRLGLASPLTVAVRDFDGATVATLVDVPMAPAGDLPITWDGSGAPDGPYTLVATAGSAVAMTGVARWSSLPVLHRPDTMIVAIDPGHGGVDFGGGSGTLPDGSRLLEKTITLDEALRTAAMLRAAGIGVVLTRTTDATVSLVGRVLIADRARADLFVSIHVNKVPAAEPGTEAFFCGRGCWGAGVSQALATSVMEGIVGRLTSLQTPAWQLGLRRGAAGADDYLRWVEDGCSDPVTCHFGLLGPYSATHRYQLLMPATLAESLNAGNPVELGMMADPSVRGAVAAAYADGIAAYLAGRPLGFRTAFAGSIPTQRLGVARTIVIRVTNTSGVSIPAGSLVTIGEHGRIPLPDLTGAGARPIGSARIAAPLPPGGSVIVRVKVVPQRAGPMTWKVDLIVDGVRSASRRIPSLATQILVGR